jgi:branched-chain amino acid transport system permease protein
MKRPFAILGFRPLEIAFWTAAVAAPFFFPRQLLILNEIAILALFALSLDLILGFAGIVSLGHAAFLGMGAYAAGIFAKHVTADPVTGLFVGALASGVLGLITSFLVLRGTDLTRLMVTLGIALLMHEVANHMSWLTGGADGLQGITMSPVLGQFAFDIRGRTAYGYSLAVLFVCFVVVKHVAGSPFGWSLRAIRDNRLRASAVGVPVNRRLVMVYTLSSVIAGVAGALLAQTTLDIHRSADVMLVLIIGGTGWLYGGPIGALIFKFLQDWIAELTPQYWQFWIGLILVVFVLVGRERMSAGLRGLWLRLRRGGSA